MFGKKQVITKGKRMSMSHVHIMKHSDIVAGAKSATRPSSQALGCLARKPGAGNMQLDVPCGSHMLSSHGVGSFSEVLTICGKMKVPWSMHI